MLKQRFREVPASRYFVLSLERSGQEGEGIPAVGEDPNQCIKPAGQPG